MSPHKLNMLVDEWSVHRGFTKGRGIAVGLSVNAKGRFKSVIQVKRVEKSRRPATGAAQAEDDDDDEDEDEDASNKELCHAFIERGSDQVFKPLQKVVRPPRFQPGQHFDALTDLLVLLQVLRSSKSLPLARVWKIGSRKSLIYQSMECKCRRKFLAREDDVQDRIVSEDMGV